VQSQKCKAKNNTLRFTKKEFCASPLAFGEDFFVFLVIPVYTGTQDFYVDGLISKTILV